MAFSTKHLMLGAGLTAMMAGGLAEQASASAELSIDLNSILIDGTTTYDFHHHTGTLALIQDDDASLSDIGLNSVGGLKGGTSLASKDTPGFAGSITVSAGAITGGSVTVLLDNGDSYTASISGGTVGDFGTKVAIDGLTLSGTVELGGDGKFGGADLSSFSYTNGALAGSINEITFDKASIPADADVAVELIAIVPTPAAAAAAIPMLGLMGGVFGLRRRRNG